MHTFQGGWHFPIFKIKEKKKFSLHFNAQFSMLRGIFYFKITLILLHSFHSQKSTLSFSSLEDSCAHKLLLLSSSTPDQIFLPLNLYCPFFFNRRALSSFFRSTLLLMLCYRISHWIFKGVLYLHI